MNFPFFKLNKKYSFSVAIIAIILVTIAFFIPLLRSPLFDPFELALTLSTDLDREINAVAHFHSNFLENEKLRMEVGFLQRRLAATEEVFQENSRLKELLALEQQFPYSVVAAQVIGRDPSNWSSALIINKGSRNGIRKGQVVTGFKGLAGRVSEVGSAMSKVMLINDPNVGVSAIIQRSRQEGLVSGSLGGFLTMKYLSRDSDIKTGDVVLTSGLTENYPKGILIGTVVEVGDEFFGLSRYAVIKPSCDLSSIEEVLVYKR